MVSMAASQFRRDLTLRQLRALAAIERQGIGDGGRAGSI